MCSLSNFFRESKKVSTLPIIIFAAFQLLSFGILPPGAVRIMTAAVTLTTASGGDPKDFSSVRLFCGGQGLCERSHGAQCEGMPCLRGQPPVPLWFPCHLIQCVQGLLGGQQGWLCLGQVRLTSLLFLSDVLDGDQTGKEKAGLSVCLSMG